MFIQHLQLNYNAWRKKEEADVKDSRIVKDLCFKREKIKICERMLFLGNYLYLSS